MARFNLDDYEPVADRIARWYKLNPDGAIRTALVTTNEDRERKQWIVQGFVFKHRDDEYPVATGLAFEIDGTAGANSTSALENAETSSIGRALANANMNGDRTKRASREEMAKVNRGNVTPLDSNWQALLATPIDPATANTLDELNTLWSKAVDEGRTDELQAAFTKRKTELA
jgi:hypothetical protein